MKHPLRLFAAIALMLIIAACNNGIQPGITPAPNDAVLGETEITILQVDADNVDVVATGALQYAGHSTVSTVRDIDTGERYTMITVRYQNTTAQPITNAVLMATAHAGTLGNTPFTAVWDFNGNPLGLAAAQQLEPTVAVRADGTFDPVTNSYIPYLATDLPNFPTTGPAAGRTVLNEGFALFAEDGTRTIQPGQVGEVTVSYVAPQAANIATFGFSGVFYTDESGYMPEGRARFPSEIPFEQITVVDVQGNAYPIVAERNLDPSLDKWIMAAQTEEPVCVTITVRDTAGNLVNNAEVRITATEPFGTTVSLQRGCVQAPSGDSIDRIYTDANGQATFTIYATFSLHEASLEPVKFVIGATDPSGQSLALMELKAFFFNITHLFFTDTVVVNGEANYPLAGDLYSNVRVGGNLGTFEAAIADGPLYLNSYVFQRQPAAGPFFAGDDFFDDNDNGFFDGITSIAGIRYTFSGDIGILDLNDECDIAPVADPDFDITVAPGTVVCWDTDGSGIFYDFTGAGTVQVNAALVVAVDYAGWNFLGDQTYFFVLKEYDFEVEVEGGALEITKWVDNHVLTWYGPDVTMAAFNATGVAADSVWTSTVHLSVWNPTDAPVFFATVADILPPEWGVITATISNNGVYNPSLHSIVWDAGTGEGQDPRLVQVDPGEVLDFTFQVYLRQKPGYCWQGTGNFGLIPPRTDCYPDPYRTVNGGLIAPQADVTVAGYIQDPRVVGFGVAEQVTFADYTPTADESDIWGVRPIFDIQKTLATAGTISVGSNARFEITIRHVDRVSTSGVDAQWNDYATLAARYPWEFGNNITTATRIASPGVYGHRADSAWYADLNTRIVNSMVAGVTPIPNPPYAVGTSTYEFRNNPYARDLVLEDHWEVGLAYQTSTPLVVTTFSYPGALLQIDTFRYRWPAGTAVVPTFSNGTQVFPRGAVGRSTITLVGLQPGDWWNCAYLNSPQLNQPANLAGTWYAGVGARWPIDQGIPQVAIPGAPTNWIADCAMVTVIPLPQPPLMTLTTNGEFFDYGTGLYLPSNPQPEINAENLRDGYFVGEQFVYMLTAENAGQTQATGVVLTHDLADADVVFTGLARLWVGSDAGGWTPVQTLSVSGTGPFSFNAVNVPAGQAIRVAIGAQANAVGVVDLNSSLTYTNPPAYQQLPLTVQETTTVQPGSPPAGALQFPSN